MPRSPLLPIFKPMCAIVLSTFLLVLAFPSVAPAVEWHPERCEQNKKEAADCIKHCDELMQNSCGVSGCRLVPAYEPIKLKCGRRCTIERDRNCWRNPYHPNGPIIR
jgi:hypothetical protein